MSLETQGMDHAGRIHLGRRLAEKMLDQYGHAVLAIYIYGSTAKNLDRPYSDLEMIAVVRDGVEIPGKYYVHQGIVVDIDYPQESNFLKGARTVRKNWAIVADQYRHRLPLFEREGWFQKLDEAVSESDTADLTDALRAAAVALTESLMVLRNAKLSSDPRTIMDRCRVIAGGAGGLILLLNRRYIRGTSRFWQQVFECPERPQDFESLVDTAAGFGSATVQERILAAERLYDEVLALVNRRGISLESQEPLV